MVKNPELLRTMEDELARSRVPDYSRNLRIFGALHQEARLLGIMPLRNPLDGIDADIRLAAVRMFESLLEKLLLPWSVRPSQGFRGCAHHPSEESESQHRLCPALASRFHGGNLAERLDLGRIELGGNIPKPTSSLAGEYLAAGLVVQC